MRYLNWLFGNNCDSCPHSSTCPDHKKEECPGPALKPTVPVCTPRTRLKLETLEDRAVFSVNPVVAENLLPGTPKSQWDIVGSGDPTLQGYATNISADQGETVQFKITDTTLGPYRIDIYRIGYYGGDGARLMGTIPSSQVQRVNQPAPLYDPATGLIDAGNWSVSATWAVPANATSGIYVARLTREGSSGASHIVFVIRDDDGGSDVLFQTSDTTWQAYNSWGGNSLYGGTTGAPAGRAYAVSYNRPFNTRTNTPHGRDFVFGPEFAMVRWLEANGYNVSYSTGVDTDRRGAELLEHRVFLSIGHDEYWSRQQRLAVETARDAGVNLMFLSGNQMYWKTRWETSIDGSGTPHRTLVCYKETIAAAPIDPHPEWTGTWRDPRFRPEADRNLIGENAVSGQIFEVNRGPGGETGTPFQVPSEFANLRFWRNTSVAGLPAGQTATLGDIVLGYEWDVDRDNGFRPAGLFQMSSTTQIVPEQIDDSYVNCPFGGDAPNPSGSCGSCGCTVRVGTSTHTLTLYRAASGALVFGAGTVQWSYGLDGGHDGPATTPDAAIRQATVNVLADMGIQPSSLQPGMTTATRSTDAARPTSSISAPAAGTVITAGQTVTITGTASDSGGVVSGVEVSVDGGTRWYRATGRGNWSYTWTPTTAGQYTIRSRVVDDSGNLELSGPGRTVQVNLSPASTAGLVAAYGFNEASGSSVIDASGSGNTGTISGATRVTGLSGGALSFDGVNDWVTVADSASLHLTSAMTLAAWVRPTNLAGYKTILMKETGTGLDWGIYASDGVNLPPSGYFANASSNPQQVTGGSTLPLSVWSHVAVTYDGTTFRLFLNGQEAAAQTITGTIHSSTNPLRIGGNSTWGEYFSGLIDEVRIYNRALAPSEVTAIVGTPIAGSLDTSAPSGSVTAPAAGATVSGTVNVTATVTDGFSGVAGVQFLVNGTPLGAEDTTAPYSVPWNTVLFPNGGHTLSARIRDNVGNTTTAAGVAVSVGNPADSVVPTVGITFPGSGARAAGTAILTAVASHPAGVAGVQFRVNGVNQGAEVTAAPFQLAWNTTGVADGTYTITAVARSGSGTVATSAAVSVTVDNTLPVVAGTTPAAGATLVFTGTAITVTFGEEVSQNGLTFTLRDPSNNAVPGNLTFNGTTSVATFTPAGLLAGTTYTATVSGIRDAAGNPMAAPYTWTFTTDPVTADVSLFAASATPAVESAADASPIELGVRFRSDINGYVTGVRFYKGSGNTGTHVGHLWSAAGALLGTVTFTNETASGWQQANFAAPIQITANTTYVISYYAPAGGYAVTGGYFANGVTTANLTAPSNAAAGGNGVYRYVTGGGFPDQSFNSTNYWVDVVFANTAIDTAAPAVAGRTPAAGATGVAAAGNVTATFTEAVQAGTITFQLRDTNNVLVPAAVAYDAATQTVTLDPNANLTAGATYQVTLSGAADLAGNVISPVAWSFTVAAVDTTAPSLTARSPAVDATAVAPRAVVTATFSEDIDPGTVAIEVRDSANALVVGSITYDAGTRTATFRPSADLATSTVYTVTVNGARDLSGFQMTAAAWTFTTDQLLLNASIWGSGGTPAVASTSETSPIELGVRFRSAYDGYVSGVRFYKGPGNTGTHVGHLWDAAGALLGTVTFTNETATGWQEANFAAPVRVTGNTTYVVSYYAPAGGYAYSNGFFGSGLTTGPLTALSDAAAGGNGVFRYVTGGGFPNQSFAATNYWVDVVFGNTAADTAGPVVTPPSGSPGGSPVTPASGATGVAVATTVSATFNEPIQPGTASLVLRDAANNAVAGVVSYDDATRKITLTPHSPLAAGVTYTATLSGARDLAGNLMTPVVWSFTTSAGVAATSLWAATAVPAVAGAADASPVEVGVRFRSSVAGAITGVRFYKGDGNDGTHVGHLWDAAGNLLGTVTFTNETATGWQQANFGAPIPITADTDYIVSYYAPNGGYSYTHGYFVNPYTNAPLVVPGSGEGGGNGVYRYGAGGGFPNQSYNAANYWVDVVFGQATGDTVAPTLSATSPTAGLTGVPLSGAVTATFNEAIDAPPAFVLKDAGGNTVAATVTYNTANRVATLTPSAALTPGMTYTVTVSGARDLAGNLMTAVTWTFTTVDPAAGSSVWAATATPAVATAADTSPVEVGVRFRASVDGFVTGVRFFKGSGNTGTHVGHLWSATGSLLGTVTFTGETASGWQQATFATPIPITANTNYVISYYAPAGGYSYTSAYFSSGGTTNGRLTALSNAEQGGNGVFRYGAGGGFPNQSFNAANYWVDVVFVEPQGDAIAPAVSAQTPAAGAANVGIDTPVTVTFSEPIQPSTMVLEVLTPSGAVVAGQVTYNATTRTATFVPTQSWAPLVTYTVRVSGTKDLSGNTMNTVTSTFTSALTWRQTTADDFAAGTANGVSVSGAGGGALELAPNFRDEFAGTAIGSAWVLSSWGPAAPITIGGGVVTIAGGLMRTNATSTASGAEGRVQFGASQYQHFGLATNVDAVAGNSWAMFSTGTSTTSLYARVNANGVTQDVLIGDLPTGYHLYKVRPTATGYEFAIDGTVAATVDLLPPAGTAMRVVASSYFTAVPLLIDWAGFTARASTGTFVSSTFDTGVVAGAVVQSVAWSAVTPTGTSVQVQVSVSANGVAWSNWTDVQNGAAVSGVQGRYVRYQVILFTNDPEGTAVVEWVELRMA